MIATPAAPPATIVSRTVSVNDGSIGAVGLDCPNGTSPLAGGVSHYVGGVLVIRSQAHGNSWRLRLLNPNGNGRARVGVTVVCRRAQVKTVKRMIDATSSSRAKGALSCGAGYAPAGWGFDFVPPDDALDGFLGWEFRRGTPGWTIEANDLAWDSHSPSGPLHLSVQCVRGAHVRTVSFTAPLRAHENVVTHACASGTAVGGGFTAGGDQFLDALAPKSARTMQWTMYNRGKRGTRVRLAVVCMS